MIVFVTTKHPTNSEIRLCKAKTTDEGLKKLHTRFIDKYGTIAEELLKNVLDEDYIISIRLWPKE